MEVYHQTPIGNLRIRATMEGITHLILPNEPIPPIDAEVATRTSDAATVRLLGAAIEWLDAYFAGETRPADLPLAPAGTPWMKTIWKLMRQIPYGQTATYGALAHLAGRPQAARAVGLACHRNPLPLFVPCHRVVGADGSLTGFSAGLALKRQLLDLEALHSYTQPKYTKPT